VTTPNPLQSIADWCEGVGHGPETAPLYLALTLEECGELLDGVTLRYADSGIERPVRTLSAQLKSLSSAIRNGELKPDMQPADALDASLDTAWVALGLARALTGRRLAAAWAELHRSNVTDKQVDGQFIKDASNKVMKPPGWQPPNFAQFVSAAEEGSAPA
jgi:predicted HAD superfamily Cof-like phosphohydrolase